MTKSTPNRQDWRAEFREKFTPNGYVELQNEEDLAKDLEAFIEEKITEGYKSGFNDCRAMIKEGKHNHCCFQEELATEKRKIVEILKEAEIECSGSCGSGCEYAVQDLINSLSGKEVK